MKLFLSALGLMLIFEGLPYFVAPEKMLGWLERIRELSPRALRSLGLVSIAAGMLLIYFVQRG